jgi:hypothetical protein
MESAVMLKLVVPGLVPGMVAAGKTWMAGTSPAMTVII